MSSAAARAEARRKAILSRGTDRLAKLTSSARGEDAPAYMHEDPPLAPLPKHPNLEEFVGEETTLPTPPSLSRTSTSSRKPSSTSISASSGLSSAGFGNHAPDPSVWSEEQQRQLMQALLGGGSAQGNAFSGPQPRIPSGPSPDQAAEDPLLALMQSLTAADQPGQAGFGGQPPAAAFPGFASPPLPPKPKTLVQKLMPLIHVVAAWIVLTYFVIWREPQEFEETNHVVSSSGDWWRRWAELGWKIPGDGWGVQAVPFFYAFTTLAIALHSWRIFSGLDPVQPPTLLSLAMTQLPPPFPSIITNGLKYLQIAGVFLDDLSAVIVALGFLIWIASWVAH
ncbi:unnamed protein product [Somion occarium]|uniref:Uncharacterized protein n=1 Tax=Somion occarium TaxID=3059160 RepID=A0ABP1CMX1_9APHY